MIRIIGATNNQSNPSWSDTNLEASNNSIDMVFMMQKISKRFISNLLFV
ncbi:hypothetical protein AB9K26_11370 [Psychroserpens sp. XS_ASV72]